jgi:L-fuculose-phosphate aldolase
MENLKEKEEVIKFAQKLNSTNLSPLRSGNVSLRVIQNNVEGFFLTPSGIKYETLKPEDIVFLALKEKYDNLKMFNSSLNPSSEWRFHQDIYIEKPKAKAIVHAHSLHATAVSAFGKAIPAFHYMVALAGGDDIKCSEYATFGTTDLSKNIINALDKRKACFKFTPNATCPWFDIKQAFLLSKALIIFFDKFVVPKVAYSEHFISSPPARATM